MLDENFLATAIRDEATIALVQLELAERVAGLASKFDGRPFNHQSRPTFARCLRANLPEWDVIEQYSSPRIDLWNYKLLPPKHKVTIEVKGNAVGKFDYMDILVRQLGPYLLGKKKALALQEVGNNLPQLVNAHIDAEHKLKLAREAFGVASHLLPPLAVK